MFKNPNASYPLVTIRICLLSTNNPGGCSVYSICISRHVNVCDFIDKIFECGIEFFQF